MDALVSGQAATAAFVEGNDVNLFRFGDEGSSPSSFEAIGRIFANCTDVQLFEGTRKEVAKAALQKSWSVDRAMRLALIILDDAEYAETKQEAASNLEELFGNPEVKAAIANQLAWTPLPTETSSVFDEEFFAGYPKVLSFFSELFGKQPVVKVFHDAWDALPDELFDSSVGRPSFREICISRGVFKKLTEAEPGSNQMNLAVFACYGLLKDLPNYRAVVQSWTQKLLKARVKLVESELDEEQVLPYFETSRPRFGTHLAFESALQQQEAIKQRLREGNVVLARRYTDDLVRSQLRRGDSEYAAKSLCRLAQEAKRIGLHSVQLEWAQRAVDVRPHDAWAHGQAADALIHFGRLDEALKELNLVESFSDTLFAATGRARILRVQNRLAEALFAYESVIREHSDYDDIVFAWSGAAETLRDMWRLNEALEKYEEAARKFPGEPTVACGRAAVLTDLGELDRAYEAYSNVLDRFGNQVVALNGQATVLREMGNLSASLEAYLAVIELFPQDSVASCGAAEVLRLQGELPQALAKYTKAIADFPHVTVGYGGRAEVLRAMGDVNGAIAAYKEAHAIFPHDHHFGCGLANIYKELGDYSTALALYDENTRSFPFDLVSKVARANLLKRLGRYSEALDAFDQVLAVWPEYPSARNSKAALLVLLDRLDEAERLLPSVPPQTEDDWIAFHIRGMILMKVGKVEVAIHHFTRGGVEASFATVRRYFKNALASERLRSGRFHEATVILEPSADESADQSVSNILRFHAAAAEQLPVRHSLFDRLQSERTPIIVELRDEIAARYGVVTAGPRHGPTWIADRQFEAILLEAA